jgi:multidrug resistance efflux pump
LLIQFESESLDATEAQIQAHIETLKRRLRALGAEKARLTSEVHPAETGQAARESERARLEWENAQATYQRTQQLWREELASERELQDAELALRLAELAAHEAEKALPHLLAKQKVTLEQISGEIQEISGRVAEAQISLTETQRQLSLCTVRSPDDGIVIGSDLFELEGQAVSQGDELMRLATGDAERFDGFLDDSGRARTRPGLPVKIRLEGYPWLIHGTLAGRVEVVADRRNPEGGFPVQISFDPASAPGFLCEGMKGQARVVVEEKVSLGRLLIEKLAGTQKP